MKKTILIIVAVLIIAGLSGGGIYLWYNNKVKLEKQKIQKELEQKTEEQKPAVQVPTSPLFTVKKIDFEKQSLENFDKNDPYYDLIISNVNKRLGPIFETPRTETEAETNEYSIESYTISSDGYLFVSYSMWIGTRLAKIDIKNKKLVSEYYYYRHCDTVCPNSAGMPRCYYNGDKNKILFSYISPFDQSVLYSYWDLSKKYANSIDLQDLEIASESELINYCKVGATKPTIQQPLFDTNSFLPKGAILNKTIDIDFKNDGVSEKILGYTIPKGANISGTLYDKYYVKVYEYDGSKWNLIKDDQGTQNMLDIPFDEVQKINWGSVDNQNYLSISKHDYGSNNPGARMTYLFFYNKNTSSYKEAYPDKVAEVEFNNLISGVEYNVKGVGFTKTNDGFEYGNAVYKVYYKYIGNGQFTFLRKEKAI